MKLQLSGPSLTRAPPWLCTSFFQFSSVQLLSRVRLFAPPWIAARQAYLSFTNSQSLLKLMFMESVMPSNHLLLCHPLCLLPSIFSSSRVFSNELAFRIRWPKYCSFSFRISPSNEYSGLISFRIDWFYLLVVQGTLESLLLQHHNSKTSILSLLISKVEIVALVTFSVMSFLTQGLRWSFNRAYDLLHLSREIEVYDQVI